MEAALAPTLALGGELVELVGGVSRGIDLHHDLRIKGFSSLRRRTVGHERSCFTRASRK
jgi:hypothetical protein